MFIARILTVNPTDPAAKNTDAANGAAASSDRADLRPESINDAVIRLAGDSQDGIQSAGAFLARLAGRSAQDVMTYMTIPATISGAVDFSGPHRHRRSPLGGG